MTVKLFHWSILWGLQLSATAEVVTDDSYVDRYNMSAHSQMYGEHSIKTAFSSNSARTLKLHNMSQCPNQLWCSHHVLSVCLILIGPQDQYQYLYKALLSLVSTKEDTSGLLARNITGTMVSISDQSDQAESMESLVWGTPLEDLEQSWGVSYGSK